MIVGSASGVAGAIVLYETALGVGIACGPLLGAVLGNISWRGPFFGVAALMTVALVATVLFVPTTPRPPHPARLREPLVALRHRGLLTMGLTALLYNWGFFTMLGYVPFPMHLSIHQLGGVFFGWGVLVALCSVFVAPRLQRRFGTAPTLYSNLVLFALLLAVIAAYTDHPPVLVVCVIVAGTMIRVNNTLTTQAVMLVVPVERPVAAAAYGFVRFIGGGLAPFAAGVLAERFDVHLPFWLAAGAVLLAVGVLATGHRLLAAADRQLVEGGSAHPPGVDAHEDPAPAAGMRRRAGLHRL